MMTDTLRTLKPDPVKDPFFVQEPLVLARRLLGKVLRVHSDVGWLSARIIETEAYYQSEKASHSSLGYTHNRRALFGPPGTIYMYYARGGDSLNFSASGAGNAVLIKSAYPVLEKLSDFQVLERMLANNPQRDGSLRPPERLCAGQTLLCKTLGLKVPDWNNTRLDPDRFQLVDDTFRPDRIIQTTRLGIRPDRDAHLPYRFIDYAFRRFCTKDPTRVRNFHMGRDYTILAP